MLMLLSGFGLYVTIFMDVCVLTVAMAMLLKDLVPRGIIISQCVFTILDFPAFRIELFSS
jgi:hypothetical protein